MRSDISSKNETAASIFSSCVVSPFNASFKDVQMQILLDGGSCSSSEDAGGGDGAGDVMAAIDEKRRVLVDCWL